MDRKALVLYLENVRDLEVIRHRINQLWAAERNNYQQYMNNHPTEVAKLETTDISYTSEIIFGGLAIVFGLFLVTQGKYHLAHPYVPTFTDAFIVIGKLLFLLVGTVFCAYKFIELHDYNSQAAMTNKQREKRYNNELIIARNNKEGVSNRTREWNNINSYYQEEFKKADRILNDFYSMNIIPVQYRKLSAVCFLYDYMSTSQESFQMALLSNHIEDGIRRIEAKLNEIIDQLDTVIWQQRVMREENRRSIERQIDQNNRMLDSLKRMETSQYNIEEYSRLSANYNNAQAFISLAYYLKSN